MTDIQKIAFAILATIGESPNGAPSGVVYSALLGLITLEEYQGFINTFKEKGLVKETGYLLTPTAKLLDAMK